MALPVPPIEFHLPSVTSTNDYARELLETYPYVFVTALHQTAGRGRKGKQWHGNEGQNAYVSLGVKHHDQLVAEELASYMMRASLATIDVLREWMPEATLRIKYPNDVQAWTDEGWAKISGALVEHQWQADKCLSSVIGIGVNVQQTSFPDTIDQPCTSMSLLGTNADLTEFIQALKQRVSDIRAQPWPEIRTRWIEELDLIGRQISLAGSADQWTVTKIHDDGRITARNETTYNERTITDGDTLRYNDRDQ